MYYQAGLLVFLNRNLNKGALTDHLFEINRFQCQPMLSFGEIKNILSQQYYKFKEGKLKITPSIRKIVYKKSCKWGAEKKRKLNGSTTATNRKKNVLKLMETAIIKLKKLGVIILQKDVAVATGKSIRTIKYNWDNFREDVNNYNSSIKLLKADAR